MSPEEEDAAEEKAFAELLDFSKRVVEPIIDQIKAKYPDRAMRGHMTCPQCHKKGALKIFQSVHRRKGRIRLFCETGNCIRVME